MQHLLRKFLLLLGLTALSTFSRAQCTASFWFSNQCDTVQFMDSSIWNGFQADYLWDFGDGSSSTQTSPAVIYRAAGKYTVKLVIVVRDSQRRILCMDSTTNTVIVQGPCCDPAFHVSIDTNNRSVSLTALGRQHYTNKWFFGDGQTDSATNTVTHTYNDTGTFIIRHKVYTRIDTKEYSCETSIQVFIPREGISCRADWNFARRDTLHMFSAASQQATSYHWNFGDSTFSTLQNPDHVFKLSVPNEAETFRVCLTVTDSTINCSSTSCKNITVQPINCGLNADFIVQIDTNLARASFAPVAPNVKVKHLWIIDELKDTLTTSDPDYSFYGPGNFKVIHIEYLLDSNQQIECADTSTQIINIPRSPECFAQFKVAIDTNEKFLLYLVNQSVGENLEYTWDMGDSTVYTIPEPTHDYKRFGIYQVTLTVQKGQCKSTVTHPVGMDENGNLLKKEGFKVIVIDRGVISAPKVEVEDFKVFPNPFEHRIQVIFYTGQISVNDVKLIGLDGRNIPAQMIQESDGSLSIDGSHLKPGMYLLRINENDRWIVKRIIKVH